MTSSAQITRVGVPFYTGMQMHEDRSPRAVVDRTLTGGHEARGSNYAAVGVLAAGVGLSATSTLSRTLPSGARGAGAFAGLALAIAAAVMVRPSNDAPGRPDPEAGLAALEHWGPGVAIDAVASVLAQPSHSR